MPSPTGGSAAFATTPSGDILIDAFDSGIQWVSGALSFSFPGVNASWDPNYPFGEPFNGFTPLNPVQQDQVRTALETISAVSGVVFTELAESTTEVGDLRFGISRALPDAAYAWAAYPRPAPEAADVWFNGNKSNWLDTDWAKGTYEYYAVIHEIGHGLGLKHPNEGNVTVPAEYNSRAFSVMSTVGGFSFYPTTPMLLDIAALQYRYGTNSTHHAGDDVYRYDGQTTYFETLWDAGGNDTLQYDSDTGGTINLNDGAASRLGLDVTSFATNQAVDNVWIAFGSTIENAIGGNGNDTLIGNAAANRLEGGRGADHMAGGDGNDRYGVQNRHAVVVEAANEGIDTVLTSVSLGLGANVENARAMANGVLDLTGNTLANVLYAGTGANLLNGGAGTDTADYGYARAGVSVNLGLATKQATIGSGSDRLLSIENLSGSLFDDALTGNSANNRLTGREGSDTLDGRRGRDVLSGGAGADTFVFSTALNARTNVDTIIDFHAVDDRLLLDPDIFTTLRPHGRIAAGTFRLGSTARDGNDHIVYDSSTGKLFYDVDGNGTTAPVLFAITGVGNTIGVDDLWVT